VTPRTDLQPLLPDTASRVRAIARDARPMRARRPQARALCAALLCAGSLWADAARARQPRPPRAASAPSTAQILAPSAATVPDALPPDQVVYRCGNRYSPRPCPDTGSPPLDVADARLEAQRRQAEEMSARDKRLAAWLEAGRHAREHAASEPVKARVARAPTGCVETAAITCVPRKPRPRHAVAKPASGATTKARSN
jgi:hypothetical protein